MKKILLSISLAIASTLTFAQTDAAAKKILNDVSKKYNSYKTIQSDFTLIVQDANKKSISNTGVMSFNKTKGQYAIKMKDQEIISNGKSVWTIDSDAKEVQVVDADQNENGSIGPNNLFTFYQKGYKYVTMPDENITRNGKTEKAKVIELSPIDQSTNYFKIKLRINKNNHIQDVTIFDKASNKYTYSIQTLFIGKQFNDSNFTFQKSKYPNFELVDLR